MFGDLLSLRSRRLFAVGLILAAALLAVLLIILWQVGLFDSAPPPATLESVVESLRREQQESAVDQDNSWATAERSAPAQPDAQPAPAQPNGMHSAGEVLTLESLAGTWTFSERGASFVGYRIGEELANIGTTTAVGRTSEIEATIEFDGAAITTVVITADLRTLRSDQSFRDNALRDRGIESDTYPFATFRLTEPIAIDALPSSAAPLSLIISGTLDLHGVKNAVDIALQGQYVDGLVVVTGSTEITLADYEIEKPTGFRVLSIEDIGIMEFELVFERAE